MALIKERIQNKGGIAYDGILGFSQGAAMTAIMASLANQKEVDLKLVIMIGGFTPRADALQPLFSPAHKICIPSLHVMGKDDTIVEMSRSLALAEIFLNPVIVEHPGKHFIPISSPFSQAYKAFVGQFLPAPPPAPIPLHQKKNEKKNDKSQKQTTEEPATLS